MANGFSPEAMIILTPASVAVLAALILVAIPPVPKLVPEPPAISIICSSIFSTVVINFALGSFLGSELYKPF